MCLDKNRAFEILNKMSYVRTAGSKEELECANYLNKYVKSFGIESELQEFEIDSNIVHHVSLEVFGENNHTIFCKALGNSGTTSKEGITAPLCYVENVLDANLLDVKGKIALVSTPLVPEKMKKLYDAGALAYIQIGGSMSDPKEMINEVRNGRVRSKGKEDYNFPGVIIHINEAEKLLRENVKEVKLVLVQDCNVKVKSQNVVATIEGTEKPEEIIAFTAHYDSVIYSNGAWDNATGSVTIMELMHYFNQHRPKRTLKFIWCGSEEEGLLGSKAYVEKYQEELKNYLFCINVDLTGVLLGFDIAVCTCEDSVAKYIDYLGKIEGFPIATKVDTYSSDSTSFAMAGVPAVTFARLAPRGGAEIHNRRDVMERLDPQAFINTVEFMVKFSENLINAKVFPVSKEFSKELTEKLEKMKKMMEESKKQDTKKDEK